MKLEYREWIDSVGGPGYVLRRKYRMYIGAGEGEHMDHWQDVAEGDKAWARRVAEYYRIPVPEAK